MNERVRIYQLAQKMNLPNQEIIDVLRELGYDIKSHSSTVDSSAVGLLIAALGKKKSAKEKKATPAKSGTKASAAAKVPPPPPPPAVKPRVLSRRKPDRPQEPGTEQSPILQPTQEPVVEVPATETVAPAPLEAAKPQPRILSRRPKPGSEEPETSVETNIETTVAQESPETEISAQAQQAPTDEKVESKETTKATESENTGDAETGDLGGQGGQSLRPMSPSVPIRVAAPSFRPGPPGRQKGHRPAGPQERQQQQQQQKKHDDKSKAAAVAEVPTKVLITATLTVKELAEKMSIAETELIKSLFMKGIMRTVNQAVEMEVAREVAQEMGYEVLTEDTSLPTIEDELIAQKLEVLEDDDSLLLPRPPVVTIMGHVDHGKTSLLDAIRKTKVTDAEAGGITQHIGAYHVEVPSEDGSMRQIVFLDTPGHEAFSAMRARGAKVTDIAVLVVAADDGVMPQTIEAIDHAKAAGVQIIVAVNKVDKPDADPDRVLNQLMEHGLLPDRFGGDTVTVSVSAKKNIGLDDLLEMILLVADMQNLKANPERLSQGVIVEAHLSRGRGPVATALVQNGTLREGDLIVAGSKLGRVRALFDDRGQRVKAAGPSMPVEVLGLDEVPQAGDRFQVFTDVQEARSVVEQRKSADSDRPHHRVTLESLHDLVEQGEVKELNLIIKADVQGTAEAIADSVVKLSNKEVQARVIRVATGDISENDVNLAAGSNAIIIGFNVNPDQNASRVRELSGVDIRTYSIIYKITDDIIMAVEGLIKPVMQEIQIGTAEIRQIFKIGKNIIAGSYVTSGKIQRNAIARLERGGKVIHEGKIETLKRFKDDAKEVAQGFECGISLEKFTDLQEGDKIHCYVIQEVKREAISRS